MAFSRLSTTVVWMIGSWCVSLISAEEANPSPCPLDYTIIPKVTGNIDYSDPPIKILEQSTSTVKFSVTNTWSTNPGNADDAVDQLFTYYESDQFSSVKCDLVENVGMGETLPDIYEAHCSTSGVTVVTLFVHDSALVVEGTKTTHIPKCCHDPSTDVSKETSLFSYAAVINCAPTCGDNGSDEIIGRLDSPTISPATQSPIETLSSPTDDKENYVPKLIKQSLPPSGSEPSILEFNTGDSFQLDASSALTVLLQANVDEDGNVVGGLVPVGRSYNGNPWENYANEVSSLVHFDCGGSSSCRVTLPPVGSGRVYILRTSEYSKILTRDEQSARFLERTKDELSARFLERTTFGPTKTEINAFSSPEEWMEEQLNMEMTSHRQFYRERVSQWHFETNHNGLLDSGPCDESARYRRYMITMEDYRKKIKVEKSPYDSSKLILSIDGVVRTVVDGPFEYINRKEVIEVPSSSYDEYEVCRHPYHEGVGGRLQLQGKGIPGCFEVKFGGIYGNPAIAFDDLHFDLLAQPIVSIDSGGYKEVMKGFFFQEEPNMIQLTSALDKTSCDMPDGFIAGLPEAAIVARTNDAVLGTRYWYHSTTFRTLNNELNSPLEDGGKRAVTLTKNAPQTRFHAMCSNTPRTFLNEDTCRLSEDACSSTEGRDADVELTLENLEKIHTTTGGAEGTDTLYVYAVTALRNDPAFTDPPCSPGKRSRWIIVDDCSTTPGTPWNDQTRSSFRTLLQNADDENPFMKDIFFPTSSSGSISCHPDDVQKFDFKIEIDGVCYENTHPDNLQVFDMTYWTTDAHPGNFRENKIKAFAETHGTWYLTYPDWHDMDRWHKKKKNFPFVGRLGDTTTLKSLPQSLQREDVAHAFGSRRAVASTGKVLVCGSPNEVANKITDTSGPILQGGFDMRTHHNATGGGLYYYQRQMVWTSIALESKDQLRQRMAFALSQIFAVSPDVAGRRDFAENYLSYYDIFVRNAFGNYFDIMKEVTYHPIMSYMLTYFRGFSTPYSLIRQKLFQTADENYAREVMQLFSIGLKMLNNNGTIQVNEDGTEPLPYTNEDIAEYAKVYLGFWEQYPRGNMDGNVNQVDPMRMIPQFKDHLPKMGINSQYIGDGYPLCSDLPPQHFLTKGATYLLLGSDSNPQLSVDADNWYGTLPKRASLNFETSALAQLLCNSDGTQCNPKGKVVLTDDLDCDGIECDMQQPRTIEVAEGLWYEYVRPACVNKAFFDNGQSIRKPWGCGWDYIMCGNPETTDASTLCCNNALSYDRAWRNELFGGERVTLDVAKARCSADDGLRLCHNSGVWGQDCSNTPLDDGYRSLMNGGCDGCSVFYWQDAPCTLRVKIEGEGRIALIHDHHIDKYEQYEQTYKMVKNDTKFFFRADWGDSDINDFLSDYDTNCAALGCFIDEIDGVCQCDVQLQESMAFAEESNIESAEKLLATATIGAFATDLSFVATSMKGIEKFPSGELSQKTIFKVTDSNGQIQYRKNLVSSVDVGNGEISFRNPVTFWTLSEPNKRDAQYELDAALEHYFYHQNVAPFVAYRLAQRFGTSNPSPRYIDTIATAFRTGVYKSFGSKKYGCLEATVAAVILDREAQDPVLDTDPAAGQLQEPLLKMIRLHRSLEFEADFNNPVPKFRLDLGGRIGQAPHDIPNVFSFFRPQFSPPGRVGTAGLVSPESQLLDSPKAIDTMNLFISLLKYGHSNCYRGSGFSGLVANGWMNSCQIGDNTHNLGNFKYLPSTYGIDDTSASEVVDDLALLLTSGRLSQESREIMKDAFTMTLEQGKTEFEAMVNVQQLMVLSPEFQSTGLLQKTGNLRKLADAPTPTGKPYKAVIYVMLSGGMDSFGVLAPESCSGTNAAGVTVDQQYLDQRGVLAFDRSKGEFDFRIQPKTDQPCESFAINKDLPFLKELYDQNDLIFLANTGVVNQNGMTVKNYNSKTRSRLFDHAGMQYEAKTVDPYTQFGGTGVLGRAKDILTEKGHVVNGMSINGHSVTVSGTVGRSSAPSIVSAGGVVPFASRPRNEQYFDIKTYASKLNAQTEPFSNAFGETWSEVFLNGIDESTTLGSYLKGVTLDQSIWGNRDGGLYDAFATVSKLIKTRDDRHADRDVFYLSYGGFDHHADMKKELASRLTELNKNVKKMVLDLKATDLWNNVTIVFTSEFARTITPNSNAGSDHAWGGNYWMMGGEVKGGRIVGKYPDDFSKEGPLNAGNNVRVRFIPTTSWDSVWHGIVQWFGVEGEEELDYVLPNRKNTESPVVGAGEFPLLNKADLYDDAVSTSRNLRQ